MSADKNSNSSNALTTALRDHFTGDALGQFRRDGYCVLKHAVAPAAAESFLGEIVSAFATPGRFEPNRVEFLTSSGPIQLTKPNVFECDLHKPESRANGSMPTFSRVFDSDAASAVAVINERVPDMALLGGTGQQQESNIAQHITLKLQVNTGGCFPWHADNPGPPNKRKLTLALYLTKNWQPSQGGELVILPFLGTPIKIAPEFNTLVLFRSDLINHRVLPVINGGGAAAAPPRYCFTIWFDSSCVNSDEEVSLRAKHLVPDFIESLKMSPLQRSLTRAVYDEEFREALDDCFGARSRGAVISTKLHEAHTAPLLKNPAVAEFVRLLRQQKVPALKESI